MTDRVEQYMELLASQLLERADAGGTLSQDREGDFVELFDCLWREMANEEQLAVEAQLAEQPEAPEDLAVIDIDVAQGHVPRRAA
jgi:hypothetical protein